MIHLPFMIFERDKATPIPEKQLDDIAKITLDQVKVFGGRRYKVIDSQSSFCVFLFN